MTEMKKLLGETKAAKKRLLDMIDKLRTSIADLAARIYHAETAAVPRSEIDNARLPRAVADLGRAWVEKHGHGLVYGAGGAGLGSVDPSGGPWWPDGMRDDYIGLLCAARPAEAIALLRDLVKAVPYEAGSPSAERPALLADLRAQLAAAEAEEEAAVDEALEAGIGVGHRSEVINRRRDEQRRRELDEQAVAHRRERQDALDDEHARRTRGVVCDGDGHPVEGPRAPVHSSYLGR